MNPHPNSSPIEMGEEFLRFWFRLARPYGEIDEVGASPMPPDAKDIRLHFLEAP
jgi:hypothetical protein